MDNISILMDSVEQKVAKVALAYEGERDLNKKLKGEAEALKQKLTDQKKTISELEEKYKVVKLAKSVSNGEEDSKQLRLKINELVREIDKCMALLNN